MALPIDLKEYTPTLETIFKILKWILLVMNTLIIIGAIFVLISGRDLGEPEFRNNHRVLIFACIVISLFCVLGLVGVWMKHFPSVLTYAILMTIALLLEVTELSKEDVGSFFFSSFIVLCAYVYAFLIRHYEKQEEMKRVFSHQTAKI